jgi:hypothetical protein
MCKPISSPAWMANPLTYVLYLEPLSTMLQYMRPSDSSRGLNSQWFLEIFTAETE